MYTSVYLEVAWPPLLRHARNLSCLSNWHGNSCSIIEKIFFLNTLTLHKRNWLYGVVSWKYHIVCQIFATRIYVAKNMGIFHSAIDVANYRGIIHSGSNSIFIYSSFKIIKFHMGVSINGDKPLIYPNSWMVYFIKGSLGGETSVLRTFRMSGKELVKERVSKERVRQGKS